MRFNDQVALVTGGGSGIGREIAIQLSREGAKLAVCGRTRSKLDETVETIRGAGGEAVSAACDITVEAEVAEMVQRVEEQLGAVTILINNAGIARFAPLWELSVEDFDEMMAANVRAAFLCARAVMPGMMERRSGRILNVASAAGLRPYPDQGGYVASKHALLGLSKVLGLELQPYGIQVQALSPGGVDTPLARAARDDVDFSEWMRPEEVAEAALFLLSQQGTSFTDHLILRRSAATPWANSSG